MHISRAWISVLIRLCAVTSTLFVLGGLLMTQAPLPESIPLQEIAKVVPRNNVEDSSIFPTYAEFTSERGDPYQFKELDQAPVTEVPVEPEQPETEISVAVPSPDIEQLELVGAAPGSRQGYAVFTDHRNGLTSVVAEGEMVRNGVLKSIFPDRVVIALGPEERSVKLTPIPGGEELMREFRMRRTGDGLKTGSE